MGMTIDADKFLAHLIWSGLIDKATCGKVTKAVELCRVETIPKDQYENRLKADMVAMLTNLYLSMLELDMDDGTYNSHYRQGFRTAKNMSAEVIQQKINALKEDT